MRRSADNKLRSKALRTALLAACLAVAVLAGATQNAAAQFQRQIGPRILYPTVTRNGDHDDLPLVMQDAIQNIAIGTRLIAVAPRAMGGELSSVGSFPWAASIGLKGIDPRAGHFCGGAFIAPQWVLTAAHCVRANLADRIEVYGGGQNLQSGGKAFSVDRIIVHEKFDPNTLDNDAALLHVTERYTLRLAHLITAADADRLALVGSIAISIGWGLTPDGTQVRSDLRRASVQIVSNQTCNGPAAYGGTVTAGMLCAGFPEGGSGSCQGDSGSPLMVVGAEGSRYLLGIVSWGEGCVRVNKFGVYTRVSTIQPWIAQHIGAQGTPVAEGPPAPASRAPTKSAPAKSEPQPPAMTRPESDAPRSRLAANGPEVMRQLGPRKLYPAGDIDARSKPLVIRDAEEFIASGRRLLAIKPRIMGGEPAPTGAYPWMASLEIKGAGRRSGHFCGGAFIAPQWVVTAAHCVRSEQPGSIQVVGGTNRLDSGGMVYPADRIIVHENYDMVTQDNDIALIHLATAFTGSTSRLITPDEARQLATPGVDATAIGWGLTREGADVSNILRRVNVEIVSNDTCNSPVAYGAGISDVMLCAGYRAGGKDSCQGDSGGPLVVSDGQGGVLQAGIVSWGEGCGHPNKYGVYTRVSEMQAWVAAHIGGVSSMVTVAHAEPDAAASRAKAQPMARAGTRARAAVVPTVDVPKLRRATTSKRSSSSSRSRSVAKKTQRPQPRHEVRRPATVSPPLPAWAERLRRRLTPL